MGSVLRPPVWQPYRSRPGLTHLWWKCRVVVKRTGEILLDVNDEEFDMAFPMGDEQQRAEARFPYQVSEEIYDGKWVTSGFEIGCSLNCQDGVPGFVAGMDEAVRRIMHKYGELRGLAESAIEQHRAQIG